MNPMEPGDKPSLTLEKLQEAIPDFEWSKGHSGVLLFEEVTTKLNELWEPPTSTIVTAGSNKR